MAHLFYKLFIAADLKPIALRDIRQLGLNADVMLNSVYSAFGMINHDATTDQTNLLMVGLRQRFGQSWEMQYSLLKRVTDRGNSSLGFQVRLRLFRF